MMLTSTELLNRAITLLGDEVLLFVKGFWIPA
jgi:hypothetical protein